MYCMMSVPTTLFPISLQPCSLVAYNPVPYFPTTLFPSCLRPCSLEATLQYKLLSTRDERPSPPQLSCPSHVTVQHALPVSEAESEVNLQRSSLLLFLLSQLRSPLPLPLRVLLHGPFLSRCTRLAVLWHRHILLQTSTSLQVQASISRHVRSTTWSRLRHVRSNNMFTSVLPFIWATA